MKKRFIIGLIVFLSLSGASFADCCKCSPSGNSNCQKACQTIFSFLAIDLSILSPRATAADVHVCSPKGLMPWKHHCCRPQCCPQQTCVPACQPQCCPSPPQCCPCAPQCPDCRKQSIAPSDDYDDLQAMLDADDNQEAMVPTKDNQDGIIPVCNKQESKSPCQTPQSKTSLFRIDLFRTFKIQIL